MSEYYQGQPYPTPGVCRETGDIIDKAMCTECESYRERKCDGVVTDTSNGTVTIETGDQVDLSDIRPSGPALSDRRATNKDLCHVLNKVAALFNLPDAILAGGAVRDHLLDKTIRDFDIYTTKKPKTLTWLEQKLTGISEMGDVATEHAYDFNGGPDFLITRFRMRGYPIEIITVPHARPSNHVKTFDIGICRVWMDQDGRVHSLPGFTEDQKSRTIRVYVDAVNTKTGRKRLVDHVSRVSKKYSTWDIQFRFQRRTPEMIKLLSEIVS